MRCRPTALQCVAALIHPHHIYFMLTNQKGTSSLNWLPLKQQNSRKKSVRTKIQKVFKNVNEKALREMQTPRARWL